MADANESEDQLIKILRFVNQSNADITVYFYLGVALLSNTSKIIEPNRKYIYYKKKPFKFKIVAKSSDDKKEVHLLGPEEWSEDKVITITESLEYKQQKLAEIRNGRRICLRIIHREEELKPSECYDILGLYMEEVRKMSKEDLKKAVWKAYKKQIFIWNPNKNFGDDEIANQITEAKDILMNDKERARHHNEVDYNKGWLSIKRIKAIFWSDCYTDEQKKAYRYRIFMMVVSSAFVVGGIAFTFASGGVAVPLFIVLGGGLAGAGLLSFKHTVSKNSVLDGITMGSWCWKVFIGFFGGAIAGIVSLFIIAGMLGYAVAEVFESFVIPAVEYVEIGAAIGAPNSIILRITSIIAKRFVDKEKTTASRVAFDLLCAAAVGPLAGVLGELVLVGELARTTTFTNLGHALAKNLLKKSTMTVIRNLIEIASNFIDERLNDSVENQTFAKHAQNTLAKSVPMFLITVASEAVGVPTGDGIKKLHPRDERSYSRNAEIGEQANAACYVNENDGNIQGSGNEVTNKLFSTFFTAKETMNEQNETDQSGNQPNNENTKKSPEPDGQSDEGHCRSTLENPQRFNDESPEDQLQNRELFEDNQELCDKSCDESSDEPDGVMIKYRSNKAWISKMIVTFVLNDTIIKKEVSGDKKRVYISPDATDVEVKFQVRRPVWGDVMKYDRFNKIWCEPSTPHIFRYKKAVERTFILRGRLWYETVTRVNDEHHEETKEMS